MDTAHLPPVRTTAVYSDKADCLGSMIGLDPVDLSCWVSSTKSFFLDPSKNYSGLEKADDDSRGADFIFKRNGQEVYVDVKFS
jgi:hypothetical protein